MWRILNFDLNFIASYWWILNRGVWLSASTLRDTLATVQAIWWEEKLQKQGDQREASCSSPGSSTAPCPLGQRGKGNIPAPTQPPQARFLSQPSTCLPSPIIQSVFRSCHIHLPGNSQYHCLSHNLYILSFLVDSLIVFTRSYQKPPGWCHRHLSTTKTGLHIKVWVTFLNKNLCYSPNSHPSGFAITNRIDLKLFGR